MAALVSGALDLEPVARANNADWREVFDVVGFSPAELSKCRAFMQLRKTPAAIGVQLDLSSPFNGMLFDPVNKLLRINVPVWLVELIQPGDYVRDIIIKIGDGETLFAGRGSVTIVQGITQSIGQLDGWLKI